MNTVYSNICKVYVEGFFIYLKHIEETKQAFKMSDATVSLSDVKLLINRNVLSNMFSYVAKQAISASQVMYCMAIHKFYCSFSFFSVFFSW